MAALETRGSPPQSPRRIAFCVAKWSDSTTVLTWAWLRQYFLHRESDVLFIVHTGKSDNWKAGGPLGADLDTALQAWPHTVVFLQGTLQSNIAKFVKEQSIDVVVLGEDFPRQSGFQIVSVSDWVRQNITCPFIIIRASAVRNERLRLASNLSLGAPSSPTRPSLISPESAPGRKVAIAYPNYAVGRHLMELAKQLVLLPQDEIFVVHCFAGDKSKVIKQTKSILMRTVTLGLATPSSAEDRPRSPEEVTEENSIEFGAKELAGYNVNLGVVLRGDPRTSLTAFCESEEVELLVISTRMAGFIRKKLTGGSVSGYLIDKAPCPCLVAPLKSLGMGTEDEELPLSPHHSLIDGESGAVLDSPGGGGSGSSLELAALKAVVEEKDRIIEALQKEIEVLRLAVAEKNGG